MSIRPRVFSLLSGQGGKDLLVATVPQLGKNLPGNGARIKKGRDTFLMTSFEPPESAVLEALQVLNFPGK